MGYNLVTIMRGTNINVPNLLSLKHGQNRYFRQFGDVGNLVIAWILPVG